MRQIILTLVTIFTISIPAQEPTFKKFYKTHKDQSAFSLNLSASFAGSFLNDTDQEDLKELIKKTSDFKLMVFKNEDNTLQKDFKKYIKKNKLKTLARMKGDDGNAEFYFLEKGDYITEIILKASSKDENLVLFGLKLKITMEELSEVMTSSDIHISSK